MNLDNREREIIVPLILSHGKLLKGLKMSGVAIDDYDKKQEALPGLHARLVAEPEGDISLEDIELAIIERALIHNAGVAHPYPYENEEQRKEAAKYLELIHKIEAEQKRRAKK